MNQEIEKLKSRDKSPEFYKYYPRLFHAYFPVIQADLIEDLSDAGYLYYQSVLMADAIYDTMNLSIIPRMLSLQEDTIKILTSIYGRDSEFWTYWEMRKREYFEAVTIEKKITHKNAQWSVYENLADKKSAFGKIAIDSLFILSDQKNQQYELLLKSHALFSVGLQLYDDVKDFREDIEHGQFNWAVYTLSQQVYFAEYDISTLNKYLYLKGIGQELLQKSITYFDNALEVLKPYQIDSEWEKTIRDTKKTISSYLDSTEGYLQVVIKKTELNKQINSFKFIDYNLTNQTIQKGLDYIRHDFMHNYAELNHVMYLSKQADDFENTNQVHYSDIFQRAILDDCLLSIAEKYNIDFSDYIKQEISYFIDHKNKDSVGGWSYFPTVKEIAADIDDLGQIIKLFIKAGYQNIIKEHCESAIQIALENKYNKDGGIATWLIPNENRTVVQEKQVLFNETKWGTGPDVEVTANFMHALHLYDSERYHVYIRDAIDYIIENQHENGYWNSRWYYGTLYGMLVCLRLLKDYYEYSTVFLSIELSLAYIQLIQNDDGGFGMYKDYPSDPLSTALAIMSLKLFPEETDTCIQNAEIYLKNSQNENGFWEVVNFIKPKVDEPYKSRTITTAYALQALSL